jgi:hypothetical protein
MKRLVSVETKTKMKTKQKFIPKKPRKTYESENATEPEPRPI